MCTFKCFLLVFVSLGIVNMIFGVAIFIEGETFSSAIKKVNHITTSKLNETSTSGDQMLVNAGIGLCYILPAVFGCFIGWTRNIFATMFYIFFTIVYFTLSLLISAKLFRYRNFWEENYTRILNDNIARDVANVYSALVTLIVLMLILECITFVGLCLACFNCYYVIQEYKNQNGAVIIESVPADYNPPLSTLPPSHAHTLPSYAPTTPSVEEEEETLEHPPESFRLLLLEDEEHYPQLSE